VTEQPELDFAGLLRQLREQALLTQEELAGAAGLSPRAISDLERGIHRTARKDTAVLLAGALDMDGPAREVFVAAALGRAPAGDVLAASSARPGATGGAAGRQAGTQRSPGALAGSPYQGLKAFGEQDAGLFFGREAASSEILDRMARLLAGAGLLVVSGASGVGKSSLLCAGVLPQLRRAGLEGAPGAASWPCLVFSPTGAPLDELALRVGLLTGTDAAGVRRGLGTDPAGFALTVRQAALAQRRGPGEEPERPAAGRDQQRVVLVVDQFEELFTLCADEGQRRAFIMALHAAATTGQGPGQAPAALVVLGVRADCTPGCGNYPELASAVRDRYLVTSMTERQLWMAITEPAKKSGARVDDDLVGALLTEARISHSRLLGAGALPWLSQALDQTWRCRTGEALTLADYERAGGIEAAIADRAQRTYEHLTPTQQGAARQVFTRLAAANSDGVNSADSASRAELTEGKSAAQAKDVADVIEAFAAERLLTLGHDTVEISHAALLTAWPLLRDTWLADTHADRIARTRLHHSAAEWARHSGDPSYLYTGSLLQSAAETAARIRADPVRYLPLSQTERDFLHASDAANRRRVHRRRGFLATLTALALGFAVTTVLTVHLNAVARQERNAALSARLVNRSHQLGGANPARSKLWSIAAWFTDPNNPDASNAMRTAAKHPGIAVLTGGTGTVDSVALSPGGTVVAGGAADGTVLLWDRTSGHLLGTLRTGGSGAVDSVAFSPHGTVVAGGTADGSVLLWYRTSGHLLGTLRTGGSGAVDSVAFSPHGTAVAGGTADGSVLLWYRASGHLLSRHLTGGSGPVGWVAFSPDGKDVAIGSFDHTIRLRNVITPGQDLPGINSIVPYLCALAGQSLTRAEWDQYAQDAPFRSICPQAGHSVTRP